MFKNLSEVKYISPLYILLLASLYLPMGTYAQITPSAKQHKEWQLLTVASIGAASADVGYTIHLQDDPHITFSEYNPIARPITNLPHPAYIAIAGIQVAGVNLLAYKMQHSARWHRIWWLPQVLQIGGNLAGLSVSLASAHDVHNHSLGGRVN